MALWLVPVVWVAMTSIKPTKVINAEVPTFYSFEPTSEHYVEIFDRFQMDRAIANSLVTVGVSTLIVTRYGQANEKNNEQTQTVLRLGNHGHGDAR